MDALDVAASAPPTGTPVDFVSTGAKVIKLGQALFGGSKSYAQSTGYDIQGKLTPRGFEGKVFGLAANDGEQYRIDTDVSGNERYWLTAVTAENWKQAGLGDSDPDIPFTGTIPYQFQQAFDAAKDAIYSAAETNRAGANLSQMQVNQARQQDLSMRAAAVVPGYAPSFAATEKEAGVFPFVSMSEVSTQKTLSPFLVIALVIGGLYVFYR